MEKAPAATKPEAQRQPRGCYWCSPSTQVQGYPLFQPKAPLVRSRWEEVMSRLMTSRRLAAYKCDVWKAERAFPAPCLGEMGEEKTQTQAAEVCGEA